MTAEHSTGWFVELVTGHLRDDGATERMIERARHVARIMEPLILQYDDIKCAAFCCDEWKDTEIVVQHLAVDRRLNVSVSKDTPEFMALDEGNSRYRVYPHSSQVEKQIKRWTKWVMGESL